MLGMAYSRFLGQQDRLGGDPIGLVFIGLALHGCAKKRHPLRLIIDVITVLY